MVRHCGAWASLVALAGCLLPEVSSAPEEVATATDFSAPAATSSNAERVASEPEPAAEVPSDTAHPAEPAGANPAVAGSGGAATGCFRCEGAFLKRCEDGPDARPIAECTSAKLCDANAGRCEIAKCAPASGVCQGNTLHTCNNDGTGYVEESCGSKACNQIAARCDLCQPNAFTCDGVERRLKCSLDGQKLAASPCSAPTPYCYDGRCFAFNECVTARACPVAPEPCHTAVCVNHRCETAPDGTVEGRTCTIEPGVLGSCMNGTCVK